MNINSYIRHMANVINEGQDPTIGEEAGSYPTKGMEYVNRTGDRLYTLFAEWDREEGTLEFFDKLHDIYIWNVEFGKMTEKSCVYWKDLDRIGREYAPTANDMAYYVEQFDIENLFGEATIDGRIGSDQLMITIFSKELFPRLASFTNGDYISWRDVENAKDETDIEKIFSEAVKDAGFLVEEEDGRGVIEFIAYQGYKGNDIKARIVFSRPEGKPEEGTRDQMDSGK